MFKNEFQVRKWLCLQCVYMLNKRNFLICKRTKSRQILKSWQHNWKIVIIWCTDLEHDRPKPVRRCSLPGSTVTHYFLLSNQSRGMSTRKCSEPLPGLYTFFLLRPKGEGGGWNKLLDTLWMKGAYQNGCTPTRIQSKYTVTGREYRNTLSSPKEQLNLTCCSRMNVSPPLGGTRSGSNVLNNGS